MNRLMFLRTSILAAIGLALCLWVPETSTGFRPGARRPTVTPQGPSSGAPHWDHGQPRPGPGFSIGPQILIPLRRPAPPPDEQVAEPEDEETVEQEPPKKHVRRVKKRPLVKLAKQRVPYLRELAMDIEPSLIAMVRRHPREALRVYERALTKAKRSKNAKHEWKASTDLGHVYYLTGRLDRAVAQYARSVEISRRQGDPVTEGVALRNLGAALTASGSYNRAEEENRAALERFKFSARAKDAQMTLNNLGVLEKNRGRYRSGADYFDQALATISSPGEVRILTLRNLATFHKLWGEYQQSVDDCTAYGTLAASLGSPSEAAEASLAAGSVYARQGLYDRALEKVKEAVQIQSTAKLDTDWSKKLMGDLLLEMGRPAEAESYVKEAGYDSSAGLLNLFKSQPQEAKKHYKRLLDAATEAHNLDEMFTAHTGLGKVFEARKDYVRAQRHYAKAVEITEDIRASLLLSERRNFFAEKVNGFARSEAAKGLARVALKQNNPAASIYAGEVTKARQFADNLSQNSKGHHFGVPPELLEKEGELTDRLAALKIALHAVPRERDNRRFREMVNQINQEDSKRKAFVKTLCKNCRDYCSVKYPRPVKLRDARIKDGEYVLLFNVLGDAVGVTLLKGKRIVRSRLIPWQTEDLEKQVRRLRRPFEEVRLTKFSPELAATFYRKLLADALTSVPQGSTLTIVPDGSLALLPFEALVAGGAPVWKQGSQGDYPAGITYVADLYPVAYYQSLTAMTLVRTLAGRRTGESRMLVMADPIFEASDERFRQTARQTAQPGVMGNERRPQHGLADRRLGGLRLRRLSESEKLGESLKGLLGANCQLYTGLECTKQTFLNKFGPNSDSYSAVVFGTHGFAANDLPGIMEPVLALTMVPQGTDGFLTMSEVAGLRMDTDLAALTACKTGLGMRLAGEGVLSMGRAFQAAGARSVLMSLWSVAEEPSILLMEEFFKQLTQGSDKVTAWAGARARIRSEGFEHPFFWASFILVGERD